jgi:hypothetical protein
VEQTGGQGVNKRNCASSGCTRIGGYYDGDVLTVTCTQAGTQYVGRNGPSNIWLFVQGGWIAGAWVTPISGAANDCNAPPPPPLPPITVNVSPSRCSDCSQGKPIVFTATGLTPGGQHEIIVIQPDGRDARTAGVNYGGGPFWTLASGAGERGTWWGGALGQWKVVYRDLNTGREGSAAFWIESPPPVVTPIPVASGSSPLAQGALGIVRIEEPVLCNGNLRVVARLTGFAPSEPVSFASPQVPALIGGTASLSGEQPIQWSCDSSGFGPWLLTARGTNSGKQVSFTITGSRTGTAISAPIQSSNTGASQSARCDPRPTGPVSRPSPFQQPDPMRPVTSYAGLYADVARASGALSFLYSKGNDAGRLAETFLGAEKNSSQTINLGNLLWEDRQSWAGLEGQLRAEASSALAAARTTDPSGCVTVSFNPSWLSFEAVPSQWYWAIQHYNVKVRGDVWLGPADKTGIRPVQLRYQAFFSDVYDFELGNWKTDAYWRLWDHGRADEFLVLESGVSTRVFNSTTAAADYSKIGLNW